MLSGCRHTDKLRNSTECIHHGVHLDPTFLPGTIQPVTIYPSQDLAKKLDSRAVDYLQVSDA